MRNFEHATLEWLWTGPVGSTPGYSIYHPDGSVERHEGGNADVTMALTELGAKGFEVVTSVTAGNWILWTLKRELAN